MTRFSSIAAWAASVGSKAKTRAGQRKAILASFAPIVKFPVPVTDSEIRWRFGGRKDRATYYAWQQKNRQERFAQSHPLVISSPPPATKAVVRGIGTECTLRNLLDGSGWGSYARVGGWYIRLHEEVSYDYNRYSKSWHNAHGGAKSVDYRGVLIRRVLPDGTMEKRDQGVTSWRGNFLLHALVQAGVCTAEKSNMPARLHPAFGLRTIRIGALSLYERTIGGDHYDYCAVWHGITFHAQTVKAAVRGLREKMRAVIASRNAPITWELGKSLGFCEEGMRQFARDFGLDIKGRYTPLQIEEAVRTNLSAAGTYKAELVKLAGAVGHPIPGELA